MQCIRITILRLTCSTTAYAPFNDIAKKIIVAAERDLRTSRIISVSYVNWNVANL